MIRAIIQVFLYMVAIFIFSGCASTPNLSAGNPLPGVGLGASNESVLLSWDPEGPLGREFRPNTTLQLVASYETENGIVKDEPVSDVRVGSLYSAVTFELPESLKNAASGQVCFEIIHNRRPLPVRIARPGESSTGFYYDEWVSAASINLELNKLRRDKVNIDKNVENFQAGDPDFVAWQAAEGLNGISDCEQLVAETNDSRPATALSGAEKLRATTQQCVSLFNELSQTINASNSIDLTPGNLAKSLQASIPSDHRMTSVVDALISDLSSFGSGQSYFEVAGLPLNSTSMISLTKLVDGKVTEANAIAIAESYSGCLVETEGRFDQSYRAWQERIDPAIKEQLNNARRAECRVRFDSYQERNDRLEMWRARQYESNKRIAELEGVRAELTLPIEKPLIAEGCPSS